MAKRRKVVGAGLVDATKAANPVPDVLANLRWDPATKRFKWDRDTSTQMVGGKIEVWRCDTIGGIYELINTKNNPGSGDTVNYQDVTATTSGKWYKFRQLNTYNNYGDYCYPPLQWTNDSDFCRVFVDVRDIVGDYFTGYRIPKLIFEFEDTDDPYEINTALLLAPPKPPYIICDEYGRGNGKFYRSSVVGDKTYKSTLIIGNLKYEATGITIPDSSTVNLNTIAVFAVV